jgi:hypothetical protein
LLIDVRVVEGLSLAHSGREAKEANMSWNKSIYGPESLACDESERDSLWRLAEKARRRVFKDAGEALERRRDRLGGHADFSRKA